jgi:hypothetical protein
MVRVLVGIHGNPSRSTYASFLAVPRVYARHCMSSNWASDKPTGPPLRPSVIRCYCLRCSSSAIRPTLLKRGPSVHPTVPRVSSCIPTRPTIAPTLANEGPSVHPTVSFRFLFLLGFHPSKIDYLINLAYGFLESLGPRNVYKDMLRQ